MRKSTLNYSTVILLLFLFWNCGNQVKKETTKTNTNKEQLNLDSLPNKEALLTQKNLYSMNGGFPDTSKFIKFRNFNRSNVDQTAEDYFLNKRTLINNNRKDVIFYYNRLPPSVFSCTGLHVSAGSVEAVAVPESFYKERLIYKNPKAGYLKAYSCEEENLSKRANHKLEIALFIGAIELLAINYLEESRMFVMRPLGEIVPEYRYRGDQDSIYTWENIIDDDGILPSDESINNKLRLAEDAKLFYKLPEKGTTILVVHDTTQALTNPEAFWQDKITNHSGQIVYLDWNAKKGVFQIRPTVINK